jgi:hypothetical protein
MCSGKVLQISQSQSVARLFSFYDLIRAQGHV